jgi:transposase
VMSDITGMTGMRILRAIVAGERHPHTFAQYRDYRITSSPDTIAKALEGDYRPEHLCTLTPSLELYDCTQQHIAACDEHNALRADFGHINLGLRDQRAARLRHTCPV